MRVEELIEKLKGYDRQDNVRAVTREGDILKIIVVERDSDNSIAIEVR